MRKLFLSAAIICLSIFAASAQLSGTQWQGTIKIPMKDGALHPFSVVISFQNDTMSVAYVLGKLPTDVMAYTEQNKMISLKKISGGVPCNNTAIGKYSYEIKDDQLYIKMIEDACAERGGADVSGPFAKVK